MSECTQRAGVDFVTFVGAHGESCFGIRKLGSSPKTGVAWVLYATRRAQKKPMEAEIDAFIAAADFRPE
jgi:hypothetical protein